MVNEKVSRQRLLLLYYTVSQYYSIVCLFVLAAAMNYSGVVFSL